MALFSKIVVGELSASNFVLSYFKLAIRVELFVVLGKYHGLSQAPPQTRYY
jgi:hypothetical protein